MKERRHRTEHQFQETTAAIYRILFDRCPDPLIVWEVVTEKVILFNHTAELILGYSAEEFQDLKPESFLPEDVIDRLPALIQSDQKNDSVALNTVIRKKTGEIIPTEIRMIHIRLNSHIFRFMAIRNRAEMISKAPDKNITDMTGMLTGLIDEPEMVFAVSPKGTFLSANAVSLEKTGYSRKDLRSSPHFSWILLPSDRKRAIRDFNKVLLCERQENIEYTIVRQDGTTFPVLLSLRPIMENGNIRAVRGVAIDISEHQRIEQNLVVREKLNMLGELTGGVVHNFNNILSVILGYIELLPLDNADEHCRRILQNIRRAAEDGAEIIKRIQNFSSVSEPSERVRVDVNSLVHDVLEYMSPRYSAALPPISIVTRLEPVPKVLVAPFEMREVLSNILINSMDAMPGGGTVIITTGIVDRMISLSVTDTGTGMTEETKRRLFEPFFTTKGKKGTGIGMSVSYSIISKFGGEIQVDSVEKRGTTITILLPIAEESPQAEPRVVDVAGAPEAHTILVIDDEENICEILREYLSREGYAVVTANGSASGIALLETRTFDIVITDLNMPGVSGWEIASSIKQKTPNTYVIMLTGWGTRIEELNTREHVVDYLLIKPINFSVLISVIRDALPPGPE